VLRRESTNLRHLDRDPHRVLLTSLLWIDGVSSWPYVPLFLLLMAPAERKMGSARWLATGLAAHVGATYVSQGYLRRSIRRARASVRLRHASDVGVSYFLWGIAGKMTASAPPQWRLRSRAVGVAVLAANVAVTPTFTEVGHLSAFVIGMLTPVGAGRGRVSRPSIPGTVHDQRRRPTVTTPEPTPEELDDDEVLTPATPGAEALPSTDPDDVEE
jgi:hypothetical protein